MESKLILSLLCHACQPARTSCLNVRGGAEILDRNCNWQIIYGVTLYTLSILGEQEKAGGVEETER